MNPVRTSAILGLLFVLFTSAAGADTPAAPVRYAGGDGSSVAKAVVILGATEMTGVGAEYQWLDAHFQGWKGQDQSLLNQDKKVYDVMNFTMPDGSKHTVYFDITDYFGKY
ncbi:MAG: hypothetical protein ACM3ZT_08140 [Bacillota bacterium]